MSNTNSLAFPNMFNVSQNSVSVKEDTHSIANRCRLLMLTEPTELYNNPQFGVGLKRHIWQYNNQNQAAMVRDRIVAQLRLNEPCVVADKTTVTDSLQFSGGDVQVTQEYNQMKLTVMLVTTFGDSVEVNLDVNNRSK